MSEMKEYLLDGKKFIQKPLVLRQTKQLAELFEDENFFKMIEENNFDAVIKTISKKGAEFLSIVLIPEGQSVKDKNLKELTDFFEENADMDFLVEVLRDFFGFNKITSLIQKIFGGINNQNQTTQQNLTQGETG